MMKLSDTLRDYFSALLNPLNLASPAWVESIFFPAMAYIL